MKGPIWVGALISPRPLNVGKLSLSLTALRLKGEKSPPTLVDDVSGWVGWCRSRVGTGSCGGSEEQLHRMYVDSE